MARGLRTALGFSGWSPHRGHAACCLSKASANISLNLLPLVDIPNTARDTHSRTATPRLHHHQSHPAAALHSNSRMRTACLTVIALLALSAAQVREGRRSTLGCGSGAGGVVRAAPGRIRVSLVRHLNPASHLARYPPLYHAGTAAELPPTTKHRRQPPCPAGDRQHRLPLHHRQRDLLLQVEGGDGILCRHRPHHRLPLLLLVLCPRRLVLHLPDRPDL